MVCLSACGGRSGQPCLFSCWQQCCCATSLQMAGVKYKPSLPTRSKLGAVLLCKEPKNESMRGGSQWPAGAAGRPDGACSIPVLAWRACSTWYLARKGLGLAAKARMECN